MSDDTTYEFGTPAPASSALPEPAPVPEAPKSGLTLLERLRAEVEKEVERPEVLIAVPERSGVKILVSPNVLQDQIKAWRRAAGEGQKGGFDAIRFACAVIGHTTRGIYIDDEEVFTEDGTPLSFTSPEILAMTKTTRPIPDCVRAMFGLDPHVEAAAMAILQAAGYDDIEATDPTKTSSTI